MRYRQPNIRFLVSDLLHVIRDVEVGVDFIFKSVGVHTADFAHFLAKWSGPGHEFSPSLKERSPRVNHYSRVGLSPFYLALNWESETPQLQAHS